MNSAGTADINVGWGFCVCVCDILAQAYVLLFLLAHTMNNFIFKKYDKGYFRHLIFALPMAYVTDTSKKVFVCIQNSFITKEKKMLRYSQVIDIVSQRGMGKTWFHTYF